MERAAFYVSCIVRAYRYNISTPRFFEWRTLSAGVWTKGSLSRQLLSSLLLLFSVCESSNSLEMEERSHHALMIVDNCVPLEDSLAGEPDCVTIRLPGESGDGVGVVAVRDIPRDVCFGPLLKEEEEEEEGTSSLWMRVSRSGLKRPPFCQRHQ